MAIDFKGLHYPRDVILFVGFFYVLYAVSYRDLEEIMAERGVNLDHTTLNRWVVKYSPLLALQAKRRKLKPSGSWWMEEAYIKVKDQWMCFYRTIENNGWPEKVVIDKSGANLAGLQNMNILLLLHGWFWLNGVLQDKYLNNMIEQDQRFIKKLTRPMKGFKSFRSASATLVGIEVAHMIHKCKFEMTGKTAFQQFAELAA